jgi:hypothetical protein
VFYQDKRVQPLSAAMSSQMGSYQAAYCIDGDKSTFCQPATNSYNYKTISALFPCPVRGVWETGTRVVITNRPGYEDLLRQYTLHLVNADGQVGSNSYDLVVPLGTYTFTVKCGLPAAHHCA